MLTTIEDDAPPESYAGLRDARASPLFRAWARDYGGSPGEKILNLGRVIKSRYARTRIGPILMLTESQFEAACTDASVQGEAEWRATFEYYTQGKFAKPDVPSSASLMQRIVYTPNTGQDENAHPQEIKAEKADFGKLNTVSKEIGSKVDGVWVAPAVSKVVKTPNPYVNEITDPDVKAVSSEWAAWTFGSFGKMNVGSNFRRRCARQLQSKLPKMEKRKVKGGKLADRTWDDILKRKAYMLDRPDASVRARAARVPLQQPGECALMLLSCSQAFQRTKIKIAKHNMCERALAAHAAGLFSIFEVVDDATMPVWPSPFEKPDEADLVPALCAAFEDEGDIELNLSAIRRQPLGILPAAPSVQLYSDLPMATAIPIGPAAAPTAIPIGPAAAPMGMQMFPQGGATPAAAAALPFDEAPAPLSAYELQRNSTIASNRQKLIDLGIDQLIEIQVTNKQVSRQPTPSMHQPCM